MQIVDCSSEDREYITSLLATEPHFPLPSDLFLPLSATTYRRLKYCDGYFPSFMEQPQFRRWLANSLHAEKRFQAGFGYISTCIGNDRLSVAQIDLVVDAAEEIPRALSSPRSVLALALPTGKGEVDNARESKQSSEKTINIRWRFPKSQQDLSVTESLPDWWWRK